MAIGDTEFRIIEYAAAFAAFGNGGRAVVPRAVSRLRFPDGQVRDVPAGEGQAVFSPEVAYLIFDILSDPDARRPMFGSAAPMEVGFKIALKTGTTRGYTDDLAFGTTREYTVGAWAGNFDGSPTAGVMAMQGAAPLVRAAFVALAARFGTPTGPTEPPGLEHRDVCALSGMLPGPDCPRKRETFVPGTQPQAVCDWHVRAGGRKEIVWPAEVAGWARIHRKPSRSPAGGAPAMPPAGALQIVYPPDGAHFLLDPGRPVAEQRPPLRALPAAAPVRWTIDGRPADQWIPTVGPHLVAAEVGAQSRQVRITVE